MFRFQYEGKHWQCLHLVRRSDLFSCPFMFVIILVFQSSGEYCMQLVKKTDYEHFLTNLFLPDNMRKEAFAIRKHAGSLQILFERIKNYGKFIFRTRIVDFEVYTNQIFYLYFNLIIVLDFFWIVCYSFCKIILSLAIFYSPYYCNHKSPSVRNTEGNVIFSADI